MDHEDEDPLLRPDEVARKFRVDPKTVSRWAIGGRLASIKTPGGHRRFRTSDVNAFLKAYGIPPTADV
jgi:excisionase family DNA binding protein